MCRVVEENACDSTLGTSKTSVLTVEFENSRATKALCRIQPQVMTGSTVAAKFKEPDTILVRKGTFDSDPRQVPISELIRCATRFPGELENSMFASPVL